MFGAGSFVVTYSILTAIVASFPPEINGMPNPHPAAQRAGIAMIFMTSIFFSVSFGPISWVLASEVCESAQYVARVFNPLSRSSPREHDLSERQVCVPRLPVQSVA